MDADLLEEFYEALSVAIESGINTPGSHAVTDLYREALARAEAAEAEATTEHEAACANVEAVMQIAEILGISGSTPYLTRKTIAAVAALRTENERQLKAIKERDSLIEDSLLELAAYKTQLAEREGAAGDGAANRV